MDFGFFKAWRKAVKRTKWQLESLLAGQETILNNQRTIMDNQSALKQNFQDLRDLSKQYLDLIVAKDAANAALVVQVKELVDQHVTDTAEKAALNKAIDEAVTESQAIEDAERAGLPGVPPVGGTPLAQSYTSDADFRAAATAYAGPEAVSQDGAAVVTAFVGTNVGALDYFTHSATGEVNTTGPTD